MIRILFVDDESNILDGLRRMLRSMRAEWEMTFVGSGAEALEILSSGNYDVIVSDLRMPSMSGVDLLETVRDRFPGVARVILSGQSDPDCTLRLVGLAHQFLSKPCDAAALKQSVCRAEQVLAKIRSSNAWTIIEQVKCVPSVHTLHQRIVERLQAEDVSVQEIGKLVAQDPGMTAKVLQVVNSAICGTPRKTSDTAQAVSVLGFDTLKSLLLSSQIFAQFKERPGSAFSMQAAWRHAIEVAALVRQIGLELGLGRTTIESAFAAGLLHDCGTLVLECNFPMECDAVRKIVAAKQVDYEDAERLIFRTDHSEVGAGLMSLWGMPEDVVEAIQYHHHPSMCQCGGSDVLALVHVADVLEHEIRAGRSSSRPAGLDIEFLSARGWLDGIEALTNSLAQEKLLGAA